MLSNEQIKQIKEQLLKQIENWSEPQKSSAEEQIEKMSPEELEEFLIKNNLIREKQDSKDSKNTDNQCIFCLIAKEQIPSQKIAENKKALAVLEINPISDGHVLIIPKEHINSEKIPIQAFSLAKKVSEKIKSVLKPKKVEIITSENFGHEIINVLPVYNNEHLGMERKKLNEEELIKIKNKLLIKKKEKIIKIGDSSKKKPKKSDKKIILPKAPVRIP